jgi:two-component system nitrogen regulation sensor histidine kinase NtrY
VFERRRGILGSKLRTRLVAAFVSLSLIPTVVLFLVAVNFLSYSIDNWFNLKIGGALNQSLEVAQTYYQQLADSAKYCARQISADIAKNRLYEKERLPYLQRLIEQRQKDFNLGLIEVSFDNQNERLLAMNPDNPDVASTKLSPKTLEDIFMGKNVTTVQSTEMGDFISCMSPVYSNHSPREVIGVVVASFIISKGLVDRMAVISKSSEEYKQFKLLKNPIKWSYIVTLSIVTLLIIFSATWFGLFMARGITEPIQDLAEATEEIAKGNLGHNIDVVADDEIGVLVDSFNKMTKDLKKVNEGLGQANMDLEQRRKYMEVVLSNVLAGVISVDRDGVITTINSAAEKMLDIKTGKVLNRKYEEVLKPEHLTLVNDFLREMKEDSSGFVERQAQLILKDRVLTVQAALTILKDDDGNYMGMVMVFEDLTQLKRAERTAAWREVAKRMAHEIKNPLTPVQLSAQRLQRKYGDKLGGDGSVFRECTGTIIDQVDVLKNLVNEFSRFARLPVTNPSLNDLNEVIADSLMLFKDAHKKDISFDFKKGSDIPRLNLDAQQIKRVMVNLLDNAVAAGDKNGRVEIKTSYDKMYRKVKVEVIDDGHGIPPHDKMKLFEPYFSTKKSGTGLGLVIVNSIISDHHGSVSVRDNTPQGTVVTFELPVA